MRAHARNFRFDTDSYAWRTASLHVFAYMYMRKRTVQHAHAFGAAAAAPAPIIRLLFFFAYLRGLFKTLSANLDDSMDSVLHCQLARELNP